MEGLADVCAGACFGFAPPLLLVSAAKAMEYKQQTSTTTQRFTQHLLSQR
jgi:hypothetical protein